MNPRVAINAVVLCAVGAAGCMVGPANGDVLTSPDQPVRFVGYTPTKDDIVSVYASPDLRTFTKIAESPPASNEATRTWLDPQKPPGTREPLYSWWANDPNASGVVIPRQFWRNLDAATCETYVYSQDSQNNFFSFDNKNISPRHETWAQCIDRVSQENGNNIAMYTIVLECQSNLSPYVHLTAPSKGVDCACPNPDTAQGNQTINDLGSLNKLRCTREITGTLTVQSTAALGSFSLPMLQKVDGGLTLVYQPLGTNNAMPDFSFPDGGALPLNLPALQTVSGAVSVATMSYMTGELKVSGLPALTSAPSVAFTFNADVTASALLANLTTVTGDVSVISSGGMHDTLAGLAHVDGNVSLVYKAANSRPIESIGLGNLAYVGGTLHLENTPWPAFGGNAPAFNRLGTVQGPLEIMGTQLTALNIGASKLTVGGVTVIGNPALTTLMPTRIVAATGDITINGNSNLKSCEASNFAQAQTAAGWSGSLDTDNTCP
jgi:hypothetical protein